MELLANLHNNFSTINIELQYIKNLPVEELGIITIDIVVLILKGIVVASSFMFKVVVAL